MEVIGTSAAYGLEVRSVFTGLAAYSSNQLLHPDESARASAHRLFRRAIEFGDKVGAKAFGGHVGAFSVEDWTDASRRNLRWSGLKSSLRDLAAYGKRHGQEAILVENLAAAREPSTMAMVRDLLTPGDAEHAAVRLALDVGHMCVPGTSGANRDPYAWLREMAGFAYEIQLQQSDDSGDHHWPFTAEANARGRIDADRVIDALGESGVNRLALVLEVIPPFEQDDGAVLDDMKASADYWRNAFARRGVAG
jgi:sugar phosphate isomerase/epimerase